VSSGKGAGKGGRGGEDGRRDVAVNKKGLFKFKLLEKFEAGIELTGTEVKSLRDSNVSFTDSYCQFRGDELFVLNLNIARYDPGSFANHEPTRPRKLLMHRRELGRLKAQLQQKGNTLIPVSIYFRNGWAKMQLGLAVHKTGADKRRNIKDREAKRDMDRARKFRGRG
jgi:SsrA-binding protein